jgi:hypothetical protein
MSIHKKILSHKYYDPVGPGGRDNQSSANPSPGDGERLPKADRGTNAKNKTIIRNYL